MPIETPEIEAPEAGANIAQPAPRGLPVLLRVALERSRLLWTVAAAVMVLAMIAVMLVPRRYTATVSILPPQQNGTNSSAMLAQLGNLGALASMGGGGLSLKNPNDLQVSLLKSRTVEDAVVERFNLQALYRARQLSGARKRWESRTAIDNGLKDGLIRLSVRDSDPGRAAEMANGWVEEYRRLTGSLAVTEASQRRLFFERELEGAHADLTRAEDNLKETEQRTGVLEMDGQAREMIASAAALRAQVAAKEVEIRGMREFAAAGNPDLVRAEQELSGMEGQLAAMDTDSDRSEGDLAMPKGKITQDGLEYLRALREMKYREAVYELLMREVEVARVDEARQGGLVQVVDPALIPDRPDSRYRLVILACALVCALPMGLAIAFGAELTAVLREYRRRSGSWARALEAAWAVSAHGGTW
jgi:tyrosine-protein kinase Etk/Wzc